MSVSPDSACLRVVRLTVIISSMVARPLGDSGSRMRGGPSCCHRPTCLSRTRGEQMSGERLTIDKDLVSRRKTLHARLGVLAEVEHGEPGRQSCQSCPSSSQAYAPLHRACCSRDSAPLRAQSYAIVGTYQSVSRTGNPLSSRTISPLASFLGGRFTARLYLFE